MYHFCGRRDRRNRRNRRDRGELRVLGLAGLRGLGCGLEGGLEAREELAEILPHRTAELRDRRGRFRAIDGGAGGEESAKRLQKKRQTSRRQGSGFESRETRVEQRVVPETRGESAGILGRGQGSG